MNKWLDIVGEVFDDNAVGKVQKVVGALDEAADFAVRFGDGMQQVGGQLQRFEKLEKFGVELESGGQKLVQIGQTTQLVIAGVNEIQQSTGDLYAELQNVADAARSFDTLIEVVPALGAASEHAMTLGEQIEKLGEDTNFSALEGFGGTIQEGAQQLANLTQHAQVLLPHTLEIKDSFGDLYNDLGQIVRTLPKMKNFADIAPALSGASEQAIQLSGKVGQVGGYLQRFDAFKGFGKALQDGAIKVGKVGEAVFGVTPKLADAEKSVRGLWQNFGQMGKVLREGGGLKGLSPLVSKAGKGFSSLGTQFKSVGKMISQIKGLKPFGNLISGAGRSLQSVGKFTQSIGGMFGKVQGIVGKFGALKQFFGNFNGIAGHLGGVFGRVAGGVAKLSGGFTGLIGRVLPMVIGGIRALGMALMTNPIGAIIGGIAIAAGLLIKFWDPIKNFFANLWGKITGIFSGAWNTIKAIFSGWIGWIKKVVLAPIKLVTGVVGKVFSFFGGGKKKDSAPAASPVPIPGMAMQKAPAAVSSMLPAAATTQNVQNAASPQYTFNITQQPGEDAESLAERVMRLIKQQQQQSQWGVLADAY